MIASDRQDQRKIDYLPENGYEMIVSVGNGRNDALMLRRALLGICLVQNEGASSLAPAAVEVFAVNITHVSDM